MKKNMIFTVLFASLATQNGFALENQAVALERLASHTAFRKTLKVWSNVTQAFIPVITFLSVLSAKNKVEAGTYTLLASGSVYLLINALREGHKHLVQSLFRKLYNKRVTPYGGLVSPFDVNAGDLPFALSDQQFVLFGFASGYTALELVRLANKCGRTQLASQIHAGEYFAQTTGEERPPAYH